MRVEGAPWVRPTVRSTPWWPLLAAFGTATVVLVATTHLGEGPRPVWLGSLLSAALAAGVALGLDDPAHEMLDALPTGAPARLLHRLTLLLATAVAAALGLSAIDGVTATSLPTGVATANPDGAVLVAQLATVVGAAAATGLIGGRPDRAAAVAAPIPIFWVVAAVMAPARGPIRHIATACTERPAGVVLVATIVILLAVSSVPTALRLGSPTSWRFLGPIVNRKPRWVAHRQ